MKIIDILKSKKAIKSYILILVLFISGVVCDRVILPWYINLGGVVKVPNVIGLKSEKAIELLKSVNLDPIEAGKRFDNNYPEGTVIYQTPTPNMHVRDGRRVYVTISGGEEYSEVPELKGKTVKEAKILLINNGLRLGSINYDSTTIDANPDIIIGQSIPATSRVKPNTFVSITLPKPYIEGKIVVPSLTNKSLNEAEKMILSSNLSTGKIVYVYRNDLIPNSVVDQYPRPGDVVDEGTAINLWVVEEPENKHFPEN